ncbi:hypothetical protein K8O61_05865 [Xanthomonas cerealis pv. cerealis]|uniref:hypothetical protein n=1 Tax=Xanthomonas cerealis TaxID=3390025 RepID=UPI001F18BDB9|nr:hypothetical protein [Xanthomonas translucens]UKE70559.1 hypothetical protein K8O61_05865 [Xanthomonas translucens pv. pistacia]
MRTGKISQAAPLWGPRQLSDVDRAGQRAVQPGDYRVFVGGGQPGTDASGEEAAFSIQGSAPIPR